MSAGSGERNRQSPAPGVPTGCGLSRPCCVWRDGGSVWRGGGSECVEGWWGVCGGVVGVNVWRGGGSVWRGGGSEL